MINWQHQSCSFFHINNFVSQYFFRISHRFGAQWKFSFLITFFTIITKTIIRVPWKNGFDWICIYSYTKIQCDFRILTMIFITWNLMQKLLFYVLKIIAWTNTRNPKVNFSIYIVTMFYTCPSCIFCIKSIDVVSFLRKLIFINCFITNCF